MRPQATVAPATPPPCSWPARSALDLAFRARAVHPLPSRRSRLPEAGPPRRPRLPRMPGCGKVECQEVRRGVCDIASGGGARTTVYAIKRRHVHATGSPCMFPTKGGEATTERRRVIRLWKHRGLGQGVFNGCRGSPMGSAQVQRLSLLDTSSSGRFDEKSGLGGVRNLPQDSF